MSTLLVQKRRKEKVIKKKSTMTMEIILYFLLKGAELIK